MWENGFFNAVNNDRVYNAELLSGIFEGLITNGVYESVGNKLAVSPSGGMGIQIDTGRGWFAKHWVNNTAPHQLTLEASDVVLNRYCAVCIRVDTTDAVRSAVPYLKYSDFATTPVKPTMTRSERVNEYCLAYVYIPAGSSAVTAANIEDTRANNDLCGWVTGLIEQLSSTTLFSQWEAIFTDWFSNLADKLNENTETMLVAALPVSLTLTLPVDGWAADNGIYKQSVEVISMNATKTVMVQPADGSTDNYAAAEIRCTAQENNALTFTAVSLPTESINVDVIHMGV